MTEDIGRVPDGTGLSCSAPSPSSGSRPVGFDPSREQVQVVDGVAYILPLMEPFAKRIIRRGDHALAFIVRWEAWGVGAMAMRGGGCIQIGPLMIAFVRVERFLCDSDGSPSGRDREAGLDGEAATARAEGIGR